MCFVYGRTSCLKVFYCYVLNLGIAGIHAGKVISGYLYVYICLHITSHTYSYNHMNPMVLVNLLSHEETLTENKCQNDTSVATA